jgi:hypothetical protein
VLHVVCSRGESHVVGVECSPVQFVRQGFLFVRAVFLKFIVQRML